MNEKLIGIEKFSVSEKRGLIKRRLYKISTGADFLEEVKDDPYLELSLVDMDVQLPPEYIAIEKIEAFNSDEGYYGIYYIIIYNGVVGSDIYVFPFSEVDYTGYDDKQLKLYLQGFIIGARQAGNIHTEK